MKTTPKSVMGSQGKPVKMKEYCTPSKPTKMTKFTAK